MFHLASANSKSVINHKVTRTSNPSSHDVDMPLLQTFEHITAYLRLNKWTQRGIYHFLHSVICSRSTSNHRIRVIRTANTHLIHNNYDRLVPADWKPGQMLISSAKRKTKQHQTSSSQIISIKNNIQKLETQGKTPLKGVLGDWGF